MALVGVGVDIVEVSRIRHALDAGNVGERFKRRVFTDRFVDPCGDGPPGALRRLQRDVLERAPRRGPADRASAAGDDSVRVLACPEVRRELEAVGNEIARLLLADRSLRLCDVGVLLAPDGCERYQAQVGAVLEEVAGLPCRRTDLPVQMLGQLFEMGRPRLLGPDPPTPTEIAAAAAAARDVGAVGISYFDWTRATPAHWQALAALEW